MRYKETSSVVYLLTREGIVSYKVLGAYRKKSKLLGATIPLIVEDVILTNGSFPILKSYSVINHYNSIKEDLYKTIFAESLIDIIRKVGESPFYSQIYDFFIRSLDYITETTNYYLVLSMFYIKMTKVFGINPSFDKESFSDDEKTGLLPIKDILVLENLYKESDEVTIKKYQNVNFRKIYFSIINYYVYLLDFSFGNNKNILAIEKSLV